MKIKHKMLIFLEIVKARLLHLRVPVVLSWALTYKCNQECLYCKWPLTRCDEVSTDEAREIIKKLVKLKTRMINLTGGEPLLKDDLPDLIKHMKKGRVFVCLNSNGVLVPDKIEELKDIDLLNLSFEGPEDIHDAIRGQGAYKAVIDAVNAAKKANIDVKFSATINKYNFNALESLVKTAYELGIKITFQLVEDFTLGTMMENPLKIGREEEKKALQMLISLKKQIRYRRTITNSILMLNYLLRGNDEHIECASGNIVFRVTPKGELFPCAGATFRDLAVSSCSLDLKKLNIERIKRKLAEFDYSQLNCKCYCANRLSANLLWNWKTILIKKMFKA